MGTHVVGHIWELPVQATKFCCNFDGLLPHAPYEAAFPSNWQIRSHTVLAWSSHNEHSISQVALQILTELALAGHSSSG